MASWDSNPRKKLVASLFIAGYVVPLTGLFLLVFAVSGWGMRAVVAAGFGLPLLALWASVLRYPDFVRGTAPFQRSSKMTWLVFLGLSQGVLLVTLGVIAPLTLREMRGYPGMADGIVYVIGLAGLPAALFAMGVLLKAWKERRSDAI